MTYRKKLIEVALPLEAINEASAREKSIRHGHPSTLHLWWARRPLAACRAVIFASLVDDPDDPEANPAFAEACKKLPKGKNASDHDTPRQRLFDFIERLVTWEATTDEEILGKARELIRIATDGNPPPLLDPFAGGGSIPLEAQRLGLEAHASDLNPVAVMINKALIEIPPKFAGRMPVNPRDREKIGGKGEWKGAAGLAADVRYYGEWMRDRAWEKIGHLYPKHNGETVIAWLWARTVKCPNPACGAQMPLVRSFDLSKKKGKRAWVEPQVNEKTREISYLVKRGKGQGPEGTVNRRGTRCLACETPVSFDYVRDEGKAGRMSAQLMAIVTEGSNGRSYYRPSKEHEEIADVPVPDNAPDTDLPEQALGFRVQLYGMTKHRDLFTPRQLVALTTFSDLVAEAREQIRKDALAAGMADDKTALRDGGTGGRAYAEAVSLYLAFIIDKLSDLNNALCTWKIDAECPVHLFARHAIPMVWDYPEANVFSHSSGSWLSMITNLQRSMTPVSLASGSEEHSAVQLDAQKINSGNIQVVISTDPPYYDNIGYADLSDFFYIWLRRSLIDIYPSIFSTVLVPKSSELVAAPSRFGGDQYIANSFFESGIKSSFTAFRHLVIDSFPMTTFYAYKQSEKTSGWEVFLSSLIDSGYIISGTWPIRTEMKARQIAMGTNALASSIALACRPRTEDASWISRQQFIHELKKELPRALKQMQSGNIAPVDLAQASIGPGMAVYSKYSKVLEPNGDPVTVRTALQLINQELDAHLAEQEGYIDRDSRFAVAWFEQFGFEEAGFGQADVLARAKDTSVDGMVNAGVLESGAGKVRLLAWDELDPGWDPATDKRLTVWEATHHLIERLNTHGEQGAAVLLAKMPPDLAADARQLAYRLYSICDRKGWAKHARDYNALVVSWSASQEQASTLKEQYQQRGLFE